MAKIKTFFIFILRNVIFNIILCINIIYTNLADMKRSEKQYEGNRFLYKP